MFLYIKLVNNLPIEKHPTFELLLNYSDVTLPVLC